MHYVVAVLAIRTHHDLWIQRRACYSLHHSVPSYALFPVAINLSHIKNKPVGLQASAKIMTGPNPPASSALLIPTLTYSIYLFLCPLSYHTRIGYHPPPHYRLPGKYCEFYRCEFERNVRERNRLHELGVVKTKQSKMN